MVTTTLVFLGPARELAGGEAGEIDVPEGTTVRELRSMLAKKYAALAPAMGAIRFAIHQNFVDDDATLRDGDEVAVIPPVSGGCNDRLWVELVATPIQAERVQEFVTGDPSLGGTVTFAGTTRADHHNEHGDLVELEYEAYEPMALAQMRKILHEACERWPLGRGVLIHRIGVVPLGETSVMIAIASKHRAESFDACRWLIDALKRDVPIWKKDVFADGHVQWVKPTAAHPSP